MFRVEGIDIWNFYGRTSSKVGYAASSPCFANPRPPTSLLNVLALSASAPSLSRLGNGSRRLGHFGAATVMERLRVPMNSPRQATSGVRGSPLLVLTSLFRQLGNRGGAEMRQPGLVLCSHVGMGVAGKFWLSLEKAFQHAQGLLKSGWRQRAHRYTSCSSQDITAQLARRSSSRSTLRKVDSKGSRDCSMKSRRARLIRL
jgi:hypothetical protein